MAEKQFSEMLNKIIGILAFEEGTKAVDMIFREIGEKLDLTKIVLMRTGDMPLKFEVIRVWEKEKGKVDECYILDYSPNPDWDAVNPFGNGSSTTCVVNDSSVEKKNEITNEFMEQLNAVGYVVESLVVKADFVGFLVFVHEEKGRIWTQDELEFFETIRNYMYRYVLRQKRELAQQFLIKEASEIVTEANNAKSQFLSNVSHEIRTPINAITGMVSILRHNSSNEEVVQQCVERLEKSSKLLMDMINDCIDKTLMESAKNSVNSSWTTFREIVSDVRKVIDVLSARKNQNVIYDYDENILVNVDSMNLTKVLVTLMIQACRYGKQDGNVSLTIKRESTGTNQSVFSFRIKDDGAGVSEDILSHFFDPFVTTREETDSTSTGLTMILAKHMIDTMHGSFDVYSAEGKGTELVISIPLNSQGETKKSGSAVSEEEREFTEMYIGRRILIAEDNVMMAEILATILGYRGLETDTAINGRDAVEIFKSHEPFYYDMIFMDIQMPVMDGLEAAKQIRTSERADSELIPIVALSANAFDDDIRKSLECGMNAHLTKPVGEKELCETINQFVL